VTTQPLILLGVAFLGTFVWVFNCEAALIVAITRQGWGAVPVALLMTAGQAAAWLLLFTVGQRLRARWRWFDRQCERVRRRWGERLARRATVVMVLGGIFGVPPTSALAALAPGMGVRLSVLLPVMAAARVVRFLVIGLLASRVVAIS
jgi:membrane protein YqaA with SNARE-associated domain